LRDPSGSPQTDGPAGLTQTEPKSLQGGTVHLDPHHRDTAQAILSHPASHNIEWRDVLSLLQAVGEVTEEHDGKVKVKLGGEVETLDRPHGKDIDEQMVVDLRRMLGAAGVTADSRSGGD
jgi:hypothetical protein